MIDAISFILNRPFEDHIGVFDDRARVHHIQYLSIILSPFQLISKAIAFWHCSILGAWCAFQLSSLINRTWSIPYHASHVKKSIEFSIQSINHSIDALNRSHYQSKSINQNHEWFWWAWVRRICHGLYSISWWVIITSRRCCKVCMHRTDTINQ